jgi:type IV secretion system protein VirB1
MTPLGALIVACGLAGQAELLEAIVRVESGGDPLALAINGAVELVRAPRGRGDAARMARWLAAHGYNFDAGLAQVNSTNLARLGLDPASVFDPCLNLRAAATVLDECRRTAQASGLTGARSLDAALSCYNTGHLSRGLENGYVLAVRAAMPSAPARERARPRTGSYLRSPVFPSAYRRPEAFAATPAVTLGPAGLAAARPLATPHAEGDAR